MGGTSNIWRVTAAVLALAFGLIAWEACAQPQDVAVRKDAVLREDAKCTRCHDESEEVPVLAIGRTKHGTRADARTPTCTGCHGESASHLDTGGAAERPKPTRLFGKRSKTPVAEQNAACESCHQGGRRMHWQGSAHETRQVACTSCHQVHTGHDRVRDKVTQPEVCFACHKEQRNQVHRNSRHPTLEGKVACSDCHNAHGTAGVKLLVRDTVNDTCYQCHMEKRGPFLRSHQPVTENCAICHNPHGSNHNTLLRHRPPWLCQQCHEPTTHQGIPGALNVTALSITQNTAARGCLNCHTNIHGSNNPRDVASQVTFRR